MGRDLSPALVALMRWGDDYLSGADGAPVVLVHEACGHELDQRYVCWSCDETFSPSDIASRPGPGSLRPAPPNHRSAPPNHPGGSRVRTRRVS